MSGEHIQSGVGLLIVWELVALRKNCVAVGK